MNQIPTSPNFPPSFFRVTVKGLFVKDGKLLLLKEPLKLSGKWELPGGGLDFGEDIHEGLRREIEEEMHLKVKSISKNPVYAWPWRYEKSRNLDWYYSLVLVYKIEFENLDFTPTNSCEEIGFFSKEELNDIELCKQTNGLKDYFDSKEISFEENDVNKETDDAVYFFTPKFYALDNFAAYTVQIWGHVFPTSEHVYQWKKYVISRPDLAQAILEAGSPSAVKKISDANKEGVDPEFRNKKVQIMEEILRAKANQHETVVRVLKETGSKRIIENSPMDDFWGIGSGNGQNMLGVLWMKIRDELV